MIGRAAAEKTWAAVRFLLNNAAARRDRGRSVRIGGAKHGDDGQANSSSNVHRAGIVADEELALREQRRQIGNCGFPGEINGRPGHFGGDGRRNVGLGGSSKEDNLGFRLPL